MMGRNRTAGNRSKGGRKKKATTQAARDEAVTDNKRVLPTPETVAYLDRRLDYWMHPAVWTRASAEQCYDNAGILWATGWFNGNGFQPDEIRDIFRTYARLYWRWYPAPRASRGERVGRAEPSIHREKWEDLFMQLDARLVTGSVERRAVHAMAVDGWHFDEVDARAMALANLGRLKISARLKGCSLPITGEVAKETGREMEWLQAALRGAFCLLDARIAKEARRQWDIPLWALSDQQNEAA
jgi:hypothetical protein